MHYKVNLVKNAPEKDAPATLGEWLQACRTYITRMHLRSLGFPDDAEPVMVRLARSRRLGRQGAYELNFVESTLSFFDRLSRRLAYSSILLLAVGSFLGLSTQKIKAAVQPAASPPVTAAADYATASPRIAMDCPPMLLATGCSPAGSEGLLSLLNAGRNPVFVAQGHTNSPGTQHANIPGYHNNYPGTPWANTPSGQHSNFQWQNHANIPGAGHSNFSGGSHSNTAGGSGGIPIPHSNVVPGEYIY